MLQSEEFFNPNYSPSIARYLENGHPNLRQWDFNERGIPAPTLNGCSAAFWIGQKASKDMEVVLLAALDPDKSATANSVIENESWFSGVMSVAYIDTLDKRTMDFRRECLAVTMNGPTDIGQASEFFLKMSTHKFKRIFIPYTSLESIHII